ncbi:MAG TPA: hypothetical protein HPQ00_05435, partial [Magnetococcales bacterium]|nr:hypothetical protein [Magnetococcales bacterium]
MARGDELFLGTCGHFRDREVWEGWCWVQGVVGWCFMSSILWAVLWAVLFFAFAGDGQAGDLPWGSQYYRVRPEGLKGSAVPDVPSQGQGAAVRPWGEVPLEWREGGADRRVPSRGVGEDRRLVPGWGYGGRWDERVSPGW